MSFGPVYVVGGRQRKERSVRELADGWYGYGAGVIVRVDSDGGVETVMEYQSLPGTYRPGDPILFKCASRHGNLLYCCTQTEVVILELPSFAVRNHVSLPRFNDVHHVAPSGRGTMLVANSGLETVIEIDPAGEVIREWNVLGEDTWSHHDPTVDYRMGVDLKPHRAHPNYVFQVGGRPWTTRFELRDAIQLDGDARIELPGERVHDGVVHDGSVSFTSVDGHVLRADLQSLRVVERVRLTSEIAPRHVLGWCRGLMIDDAHCWVGFSRIRSTKLRQTVSWVRTGERTAPTRIARYRLSDWEIVCEVDLEPHGLNAVFSVLPAL